MELAEKKLQAEKELAELKAQAEQERIRAEQKALAEQERARAAQAAAIGKEVAEYTAKITAKIRRNIVMLPDIPYNVTAEFYVTLLPGGMVLKAELIKPSGSAAYDSAVERAIKKAQPLPLPPDAALFDRFRELRLTVRPIKE
jgi:colicin import membrane protein